MPLRSVFSVVFFAPLVAGKFLQFLYQFRWEKSIYFIFFAKPPAAVISRSTSILNILSTAPKNTNTATRKSKVHFTWEISVSALKKLSIQQSMARTGTRNTAAPPPPPTLPGAPS